MRPAGLVLTVVLGALGAQAAGETAPPAVWLGVGSIPKLKVRWSRYSAAKVDDLEFTATIAPQVRGTHRLGLKVYTPRGHLYQTLSVRFVVPPVPSRRRPPFLPQTVLARLPVSGTLIVMNSLYGPWRVVPHLDDAAQPCGRELRFEITR
jgi:hypothetical protein